MAASDRRGDESESRPLLSDSDNDSRPAAAGSFARNLGTRDAFAVITAIVVGSGVFTSPGSIDSNVPSPGVALAVWLVGGVLAWTGASTMAELGTAIPGEGGVQPFLKYAFGDMLGFLAAWTWVVAVMPATLAILSIVFVESLASAVGVTDRAASLSHKLLSVLVMALINCANCISTAASTRLNGFFVATKFLCIGLVVLAGLVAVVLGHDGDSDWRRRNWFAPRDTGGAGAGAVVHWADVGAWELLGYLSTALYGALWAYSGWDKGIYVSAELSDPVRQLPLAINTAVPAIVVAFLAANAAYYVLLPWDLVATTDSVAVTAITRLLGRACGIAAAVLICLVVAGSLLGNSFVAGRMAVAAANANWLPSAFATLGGIGRKQQQQQQPQQPPPSSQSDAPLNAIVLNTLLSALFVLLGDFRSLVTFNGLGEYTFFFLTVVGAVVLRVRAPDLARPYKPVLAVPLAFAVVAGFVLVRGAVFAPAQALVLVGVWCVGLVFYGVRRRWMAAAGA